MAQGADPIKNTQNYDTASEATKVKLIAGAWKQLEDRWREFREKQIRNYDYVIGKMIKEEIRKRLNEDRRPIFEFMLLQPLIQFVAGKLKRDATKMKAEQIHGGSEEAAYMRTVLTNDWAMERCQGYNEIAKAGIDAFIGGMGFINNQWTMMKDPEGAWTTECIDPTATMFDPDCRDVIGQKDMRVITFSKMYAAEELIEIYKDFIDDSTIDLIRREASRQEAVYSSWLGTPRSWYERYWNSNWNFLNQNADAKRRQGYITAFNDARNGLYRAIEWHDKRVAVKKFLYSLSARHIEEIPDDKVEDEAFLESAVARFPDAQIETSSVAMAWITVVIPGLLPDKIILERPYPVQERGFAIKVIPAYNFHPDATRTVSGVDPQIAPIDLFNQKTMSLIELTMDLVNPPIEAEEGSISPTNEPGWKSKTRGIVRYFKKGFLKPEHRQPPVGAMQALQALQELSGELNERLSGISPEARGFKSSGQEGASLFAQKTEQTDVMMSHFFDNMQEVTKQVFNYCSATMTEFLTPERMMEILADTADPDWLAQNMAVIQTMKMDQDQGEYDFKPDVEALGETTRRMNVGQLIEVTKLGGTADPVVMMMTMGEIFKYLDVPGAKRIAKYIESKLMGIEQMQDQQQQAAAAQQQLQLLQGAIQTRQNALQPMKQAKERVASATPA